MAQKKNANLVIIHGNKVFYLFILSANGDCIDNTDNSCT